MLEEEYTPQEDDYIISDCGYLGGQYQCYQYGVLIYVGSDMDECRDAIFAHMEKEKYYPSVWYQDDHGGIQAI